MPGSAIQLCFQEQRYVRITDSPYELNICLSEVTIIRPQQINFLFLIPLELKIVRGRVQK